jgi:hypothetical protein
VPTVVTEDLGAHTEPETADEPVGDDHADDHRPVSFCHAGSMAENLR